MNYQGLMKKLMAFMLFIPLLMTSCGDDEQDVVYQQLNRVMTLEVANAGSLSSMISSNAKDDVLELTLSGKLNGSDILFIREMAGADVLGDRTEGSLRRLDMSDAVIVEGGDTYYRDGTNQYVTSNNVIGDHFFDGCKSLVSVVLPTNVVSVGDNAFNECYLLQSVGLSTGVVEIGDNAFRYCHDLTSIDWPLGLQVIGDAAFTDCYSLKSLDFQIGLTSIGAEAFAGCSSIVSASFPQGLRTIGYSAFSGCVALNELHSSAVSPPECQTGVFESVNRDVCKLFVPRGSANVYQQANEWKEFKNVIEE